MIRLGAITTVCAMLAILPVHAQTLVWHQFERPASEMVPAAFSTPFGRFIIQELALGLAEGANVECRSRKNLNELSFERASQQMYTSRGVQMFEKLEKLVSRDRFEAGMAARGGAQANAEREQLKSDAVVQQYRALLRPAEASDVIYEVAEQMRRFLVIRRVPVKRALSGLENGDPRLLDADPAEKARDAADRLAETDKSPQLSRYRTLTEMAEAAFKDSITVDLRELSPRDLLDGLAGDLAEVCVPTPD